MTAERQLWVWHTVKASLGEGIHVRDEFVSEIIESSISNQDADTWKLCFSEAFANACKHGSTTSNPIIKIGWSICRNHICLRISDSGQGPSKKQLSSIALPDNPLTDAGRGLYILNELCDSIEHWMNDNGHFIEMKRFHTAIEITASNDDSEAILNELGACYESLATFYRMGEKLSNPLDVTTFCTETLEELKQSHSYDHIELLKAENCTTTHVWNEASERPKIEIIPTRLKQGCILPVQTEGKHWGCLLAGRETAASPIRSSERDILKTVSDILGITMANEQLMHERDSKQKSLREYELAKDLQASLLPIRNSSNLNDKNLIISRKSAREIAGDFADVQKLPDGSLMLFIADVMGKGVQAASLALVLRSLYFHISNNINNPADVLNQLNKSLVEFLGNIIVFATCAIVKISPDNKTAEVANAGHVPVILNHNGQIEEFNPSGMPLGIESHESYCNQNFSISANDKIFMTTDGYYEWKMNNGKFFGWENFKNAIRKQDTCSIQQTLNDLHQLIGEQSNNTITDDQTMIIWRADS